MRYFSTKKINSQLLIPVIILLFVVSFGTLGFALMDHSNMQTCLIGNMALHDCALLAKVTNETMFAIHHIGAFRQFIQITPLYTVAMLSLVILMVAFFKRRALCVIKKYTHLHKLLRKINEGKHLPFISPLILKWLTLHNKQYPDLSIFVGS